MVNPVYIMRNKFQEKTYIWYSELPQENLPELLAYTKHMVNHEDYGHMMIPVVGGNKLVLSGLIVLILVVRLVEISDSYALVDRKLCVWPG